MADMIETTEADIDVAKVDETIETEQETETEEVIETEPVIEPEEPVSPYDLPGDWYVIHSYSGYENKV